MLRELNTIRDANQSELLFTLLTSRRLEFGPQEEFTTEKNNKLYPTAHKFLMLLTY